MCSLTENELEPVMEPADRLGVAEGQQLTCKKCRVNKSVVKLRLALSWDNIPAGQTGFLCGCNRLRSRPEGHITVSLLIKVGMYRYDQMSRLFWLKPNPCLLADNRT